MPFKMVFVPPQGRNIDDWVRRLTDAVPDAVFVAPSNYEEAKREIAEADAAFGTLPRAMLAAAKRLKWLQAPAAAPNAGYYYPELVAHPCTVTNYRGIYNDHISVYIVAMMLSFTKHLHLYRDRQNQRKWEPLRRSPDNEIFLSEATAVIVGVGGIGAETAHLCKALGMTVLGIDARRNDKPEGVDDMAAPDRLDEYLAKGDFVILTIPHTPKTEGLFNSSKFKLMKNSAIFINVGRGITTKLDDLNTALRSGEIAGAGLDVYEIEPLPKDHPLWDAPNTILTPHIAAAGGKHIEERRYEIILENVRHAINGEQLRNVVDKEHWF